MAAGLGARAEALASWQLSWALLLGYGSSVVACLPFLGLYLDRLRLYAALHCHRWWASCSESWLASNWCAEV